MTQPNADFYQLSGWTVILLLVLFYGGTLLMSALIGSRRKTPTAT